MTDHALTPETEQVPAYPKWEWDCPACEATVLSEFPPPADDECDVCGFKVRTDQR